MLLESLASWIGLPIVAVLLGLGLALLLERATGVRMGALRIPIGLCVAICVSLGVYWLKGTGPVALAVLVVAAVAGLILERNELRGWRPGWMTLAWLAAYGLHIAPVVLSGEWGWLGYNFVNDTAVQLMLTERLADHGMIGLPVTDLPNSVTEYIRSYTATAYPLGSHALLATLGEVVRVPVGAVYQPYIAVLSASAAVALAHLARRAGMAAPWAAAAGALAAGANLFYQYALQGNVKEVAFFMAFAAAAGAGRELVKSEQPLRWAVPTAFCFAAAFVIYSSASGAYLLALGAVLAAAALWVRRASIVSLLGAGAVLLAGALVFALPALSKVGTFNAVATGTFGNAAVQADLGHLARPLELSQAAGVWITGDYRVEVPPSREWITTLIIIVVLGLVLVGVVGALRRREPAALLLLVASGLTAAYLLQRLSPYADGKVLALASPVLILGAGIGAWELSRVVRLRPVALVLAAAVLVGVLWSDAYAYHVVKITPVDRLEALEAANRSVRDADGLVMLNEPEEFGKVYNGGAPVNAVTEAVTGKWVQLRVPAGFNNLYFDLDLQTLAGVEEYPAIVKRVSPDASRPPANYRLKYANEWYEAWVREDSPQVIEHLPLQGVKRATAVPACADVEALAAKAEPGDTLVASARSPQVRLDPLKVRDRPYGWVPHPWQEGMIVTLTPGLVERRVRVEQPGRYKIWIAGGFGRPISVSVDGQKVGEASGVNNVGQYLPAGEVELSAGTHEIAMERPGGGLAPSDGYIGELGPLVFEAVAPRPALKRVAPEDARSLCGKPWDWIELVREAR